MFLVILQNMTQGLQSDYQQGNAFPTNNFKVYVAPFFVRQNIIRPCKGEAAGGKVVTKNANRPTRFYGIFNRYRRKMEKKFEAAITENILED